MNTAEMLRARMRAGKHVCFGLDINPMAMPAHLIPKPTMKQPPAPETVMRSNVPYTTRKMVEFGTQVVDATSEHVAAYKPNLAFYQCFGPDGIKALMDIVEYIRITHPDIPVILDAKYGDIGATNEQYAYFTFDVLGVHAVTLNPYVGGKALESFLSRADRYCFILARTSNPGSDEFQRTCGDEGDIMQPFLKVAYNFTATWNLHGNVGLVGGATYPAELAVIRNTVGNEPIILIPGYGKQGGDLQKSVVNAASNGETANILINVGSNTLNGNTTEEFAMWMTKEVRGINDEISRELKASLGVA